MAPNALVTGTSGFVAGHLARRLLADGYDVTGVDIKPPRSDLGDALRQVTLDIRDRVGVRALLQEIRPELVIHAAAQASVSVSMREPRLDVETNVVATLELAQEAAAAGTQRFVFFSSGGAVYGEPAVLPATEETAVEPKSIYGASKAAAELYLGVVADQTGLEVSVLRPANIYGPEQNPHGEAGVMAIFSQRMLRNELVTIFGDGSQTRDYVYVEDVVEAAIRASDGVPDTCDISTGIEVSTGQVFETLAQLTGYEQPVVHDDERPGDIARSMLDPTKAGRVWGWEPQVAFEDGVARTVEWFREQEAVS
ncbi:MAG: NAD-dependent epimerase/dehydratase family protein [Dehalococcoidia bacterium]|jgi:UDP-glucose 4-epimerase|nr:NAD-dependent epimerase/dehydratase family protein [Dehalococcoidia bacterium]